MIEVASSGAVRAAPLKSVQAAILMVISGSPYTSEMSARQPAVKVTAPGAGVISKVKVAVLKRGIPRLVI